MRQIAILGIVSILTIGVLLTIGCSDDDVTDPDNQAPTIQSITANPDTIVADRRLTVTVDASDPDDDELSYGWDIHGESFWALSASDNRIELSNCCSVTEINTAWIVALVSDEHGATTRDSVQVWVIPKE